MKVIRLIFFYLLWKDRWIISHLPVNVADFIHTGASQKLINSQMKLADAHYSVSIC